MSKENSSASIADQVVDFIEKNKYLILGVLALIAVIGIGTNIYKNQMIQAQKDAYVEAYNISKSIEEKQKDLKPDEKVDFNKTFADVESRSLAFISANKDKNAAVFTALALSDLYLKYDKTEKAKSMLEGLAKSLKPNEIYYGLVQMNYASVLMAAKDFNGALAPLEAVIAMKTQKHLHPTALVKLGVCHFELKNTDEAKRSFTRVTDEYAESSASSKAKSFLRWLTINKG